MKKLKDSFHTYAFATCIFWSMGYVLTRMTSAYLPSIQIGLIRTVIAAITLLVVVLVTKLPWPKGKDIKWFILSGLTGMFLYMLCFNMGCVKVTTATGNVMLAMSPVLTAIGSRILFKEKLSTLQWSSIVICFVGVVVLTVVGGGFSVNIGLMWLMLAVLLLSIYNLIQKYLSRNYPSLGITAFSFIVGGIGYTLCIPVVFDSVPVLPVKAYILLLLLGVGCSGVGYCLWTKAFSKAANASSVSNYMFLNPFIGALFGAILIGDPVEKSAIFGGTIIMIGLFLFNFGPSLLAKYGKSKLKNAQ